MARLMAMLPAAADAVAPCCIICTADLAIFGAGTCCCSSCFDACLQGQGQGQGQDVKRFSGYMHELCFSKWLPATCPLCRKSLCTLQYQQDAIARALVESSSSAGVIDLTRNNDDAVIDLTDD